MDDLKTASVTIEDENKKEITIPEEELYSRENNISKETIELHKMTEDDLDKSQQLHKTINDFRSNKDRNAIFEKHYGNIDTNIGVKQYNDKETNGSYDSNTNTIFTVREKMPHLKNGFTNIKNKKPLDENQTLAIKDYGHEGIHYWQKNLDKITDDISHLDKGILEALTEMQARKVTTNYLEEACKGTRGNPNFKDIINSSKTYQNVIKGIDDFCKDYRINKRSLIKEFTDRTHKDNFDPNESTKTLLEIINNKRDKKLDKKILRRYIPEN